MKPPSESQRDGVTRIQRRESAWTSHTFPEDERDGKEAHPPLYHGNRDLASEHQHAANGTSTRSPTATPFGGPVSRKPVNPNVKRDYSISPITESYTGAYWRNAEDRISSEHHAQHHASSGTRHIERASTKNSCDKIFPQAQEQYIPSEQEHLLPAEEKAHLGQDFEHELPLDDLPGWLPPSLHWLPWVILLSLATIVGYTVLFALSEVRGIISTDSPGVDKVFLHGPTLIGILIGELLARITIDLECLLPYFEMAKKQNNARRHSFSSTLFLVERKAIPFMFRHPLLWIHRVFDRLTHEQRANITRFLGLFTTIVLPALLAATFSLGSRPTSTTTRDFRVMDFEKMATSLNGTTIPSIGVSALLKSPVFSDIKWLSWMDTGGTLSVPSWAGAALFEPLDNEATAANEDQLWRLSTDAISSALICRPMDIQASVSSLVHDAGTTTITGLSLDLVDTQGCHFSSHWNNISTLTPAGINNPILLVEDVTTFALWAGSMQNSNDISAGTLPSNTTISGECDPFRHFIVSGSIQDDTTQLSTGLDTDWAGVSCSASWYIDSNIGWEIKSTSESSLDTPELTPGRGTQPPESVTNALNALMMKNFIGNSLIYSLSDPHYSKFFWKSLSSNVFTLAIGSLAGGSETDCSRFEDPTWSCEQHKTHTVITSLWSFLVAAIPMVAAPFLPLSGWKVMSGSIVSYKTGWYIQRFPFGFAVALLLVICVPLLFEPRLQIPRCIRSLILRISGMGRQGRSGLHGTPATFAGLAFYFRDNTVRKLFDGIDLLDSEMATDMIRRRLAPQVFSLRRWQRMPLLLKNLISTDLEPAPARVRAAPRPSKKDDTVQECIQPSTLHDFDKLMIGDVPLIFSWWLLLLIGTLISAAAVVAFLFIIHARASIFSVWHQGAATKGLKAEFLSYAQRLLFLGLPPLFLSIIASLWWADIDIFFRRTQPFASLKGGALASRSVDVQYIHDLLGVVSFKAIRNRHGWLALVTCITLVGKIAIFMSAGIFKMKDMVAKIEEPISYYSVWRKGTFPAERILGKTASYRQLFMSLLIFNYSSLFGWKADSYQFPALWMEHPAYNLTADGLKGSLKCHESTATLQINNGSSTWDAVLDDGECAGATRHVSSGTSSGEDASPSILVWTYLNRTSCSQLSANDTGRWWVLSSASSDITSLLCTPELSLDRVNLTVQGQPENDNPNEDPPIITINSVLSKQHLPTTHWTASGDTENVKTQYGNDAVSFLPFASSFINSSLSTTTLIEVSPQLSVDNLGVMLLMLNSKTTKQTSSLASSPALWSLNASTLADAADRTFGLAINALIGLDISSTDPLSEADKGTWSAETILLQRAPADYPPATGSPKLEMAVVQPGALYAAIGALFLYLLAIPVVWIVVARKNGGWRPPRDLAYPANAIAMIYDSSLVEKMEGRGERITGKRREGGVDETTDWMEERWGFGVFRGARSGKLRVGIETVDRLEDVHGSERGGGGIKRRRGATRGTSMDEVEEIAHTVHK